MPYNAVLLESGILYHSSNRVFGYNAWPSVARLEDGDLAVVFTGHQMRHISPFGKLMLVRSTDEGKTWSAPSILIDSVDDDRDAGICSLGGGRVMATCFAIGPDRSLEMLEREPEASPARRLARAYADVLTSEETKAASYSKYVLSCDNGATWSEPKTVAVTNTGGPALLEDGTVLYVGNPFVEFDTFRTTGARLQAYISRDGGETFEHLSDLPTLEVGEPVNFCEAHALALGGGRVLCHIRAEYVRHIPGRRRCTPIFQSVSPDGGKTWSVATPTELDGLPPFLTKLSSGLLLSAYGRRWDGDAILAAVSADGGENWQANLMVDDYPKTGDMGYPATVELADGSLYTVYYCANRDSTSADIRFARWRLT